MLVETNLDKNPAIDLKDTVLFLKDSAKFYLASLEWNQSISFFIARKQFCAY